LLLLELWAADDELLFACLDELVMLRRDDDDTKLPPLLLLECGGEQGTVAPVLALNSCTLSVN
jgi:hypothetical protein